MAVMAVEQSQPFVADAVVCDPDLDWCDYCEDMIDLTSPCPHWCGQCQSFQSLEQHPHPEARKAFWRSCLYTGSISRALFEQKMSAIESGHYA